ncbi:MAG: DUF4294 domain-containing protein [Saprospiraceae bacterium]|nr:DUF4294 domain-containing protein [Saprospiraceae bacterium]MCB0625653.1 DUF4294 domain-containing protein [Saprospiraceae bacterium]MCB0678894.1 DUF4294 domain-containing protein [Saprospiraceae bacterium]MCB0683605.1 DUF4294 domain-containing protein [Saprospiraceae bacterium]
MKNRVLFFALVSLLSAQLSAQAGKERIETVKIDGYILQQLITEEGDTILLANLDDVSVTSPRKFANKDEYLLYLRYRAYANKVYPYAREAIRIFRETEYATETMKKRDHKKYIKELQKQLKDEFEDPLKNLSKNQGRVLVKMIERELDTSMFELIKGLRGGFTATYWSTFSRFYGYRLKEAYQEGEDPILDAVLQDFDISSKL